jgi:hypothetical protein
MLAIILWNVLGFVTGYFSVMVLLAIQSASCLEFEKKDFTKWCDKEFGKGNYTLGE